MPVLAALGLYAKAGLSGLWGFLKGASAWQILCLAMGALLIVQHFQLVSARHSAAKWEALSVNYRRQLDSISTAKNVQRGVTTRTVEKVIQGQKQIQTVVKVIHDAPNPPDCGTPALSDLRNEL